jgi:Domain of unknown function (DUF1906)
MGGNHRRDILVRTFKSAAKRSAEFVCLFLANFTIWASAAHPTEYCVRDPQIKAVDLSAPVDQYFLNQMKANGISTIIRYYDHENETLPGKTLRKGERDLIMMNGLTLAVVFQHHNDQFVSFTPWRGSQDAERSLVLASENSQLPGSAIYFGVDGPWKRPFELSNIMSYFQEVRGRLMRAGFRVGVYGSGLVCNMLQRSGLADLCWLAAPISWPEFHDYYPTRQWRLVQQPTTQCGGRMVDFNLANGPDFGQFGIRGSSPPIRLRPALTVPGYDAGHPPPTADPPRKVVLGSE